MHFRVLLYAFERISIGCLLALYIKKIFCPSGLAMGQCRLLSEIICICTVTQEPFINDVTHLAGKGGSAKRWRYSISLFSKMGDEGEGGVKNLKNWVTSFMDGPHCVLMFFEQKKPRCKKDKTGLSKIRYLGSHLLKIRTKSRQLCALF